MSDLNGCLNSLRAIISSSEVNDWPDILAILKRVSGSSTASSFRVIESAKLVDVAGKGLAFITYDFGIDGVSIEIQKYAIAMQELARQQSGVELAVHCICGDFYDKADIVLEPGWHRFAVPGMNGWSKWDDGKWFSRLYYEDMPSGSEQSRELAREMWRQSLFFTDRIGDYLVDNGIKLIVPVNIPTNPGNFPVQLALIMLSEALRLSVISSNHDFYWEGGEPAVERVPGEPKGPRDHFFRNCDNSEFFELFRRMYPWNGRRWLQVNINSPQSEALVNRFGFSSDRVFELGTSISDRFFASFDESDVRDVRRRMAYILSDGSPIIEPVPIETHLAGLGNWMKEQHPLCCGARAGLSFDPALPGTIYCLQPTRVIARKRIEKDLHLLRALFARSTFRQAFEADPGKQFLLHITGPVPIEHQSDLERVLNAYRDLLASLPASLADRVFIAFSVGTEDHPAFSENGLEPLCIEQIYRLATAILFPSETEGRGLPIIESSAAGIPIVCSRYYPEEVFAEVVGEGLPEDEQIRYFLFPEGEFTDEFLDEVGELLLNPAEFADLKAHNKDAVRARYSMEMIRRKFAKFAAKLAEIG